MTQCQNWLWNQWIVYVWSKFRITLSFYGHKDQKIISGKKYEQKQTIKISPLLKITKCPNWRLGAPTESTSAGQFLRRASREEAWKLPYPGNKISSPKLHIDATLTGYIWLCFYFRLKPPMIVFLKQRTKKTISTPSPRTNISNKNDTIFSSG